MTELSDQTTRRAVLGGVAAVGAGAVLAACGGDTASDSKNGGSTSGSEGGESGGDAPAGGVLGTTDEIPVGGGTVYQKAKVVVTQPTEGDFKAFSAVCTHSGCTVGAVKADIIQCNCHGSQYSSEDGSVKKGPAPEPLAAKKLEVDGDKLIVS